MNASTHTEMANDPEPQLYDLSTDLAERTNVAVAHPDKVKELQAQLDRIRSAGRSRP